MRLVSVLVVTAGLALGAPACKSRDDNARAVRTIAPRASASSARDATVHDGGSGEAGARTSAALRTLERARVPAIALATVREGKVECEAFGLADVATGRVATPGTVFHAASLAKPIVAMTVLRLVDQHALRLDADISAYVGFPVRHPAKAATSITLRRLLAHVASVRDDIETLRGASVEGDPPLALAPFLMSYVSSKQDGGASAFYEAAPGTRVQYSNVSTALAALAVEKVAGERFDLYTRRTLLGPLGIRVRFRLSEMADSPVAVPHVWRASAGRFEPVPMMGRPVYPASDLRTDVCSLGRLLATVANGGWLDDFRALSDGAMAEMFTVQKTAEGPGHALGWQSFEVDGMKVVGHEGEDDGVSAVMALDRTRRVGAVVLANGDAFSSGDPNRAAAITELLASLLRDR